ncbi:MAG TPA: glucosamine-6-phosphate deaminase [Nitrospiraceae bacterium]|nr:glucosamine-6-phosphate deaminase [Nitrospiraceae bacterium]
MMLVLIGESAEEAIRIAGSLVAQAIKKTPALRLGLAAGKTPIGLYRNLVDLHRATHLDFSHVRLFSLDEFMGLPRDSSNSYRAFFHQHLIDHINIDPAHLHLLNGPAEEDVASYCASYELLIRNQGGIDLQILGIGGNGHLGFNEPGSSLTSRTRLSLLSESTRRNLARVFDQAQVPEWAVTMGLGTIREARTLLLLAFGAHKAEVVAKALEGPLSASTPASSIQLHPGVILVLDREAAASLKIRNTTGSKRLRRWRYCRSC